MFIVSFDGENEDVSLVVVVFELAFLDYFKFFDPNILLEPLWDDEFSLLVLSPLEWLTCGALDIDNLSLWVRFVNVIDISFQQSCLLSDD